jgi:AraC-like DNA-binding protein
MRHLATTPAADRGWIAALRDPVLAPALPLLHGAPGRRWTVASLASASASSRSLLGERFRRVGYDSEEAFSRAFKRAHGQAPTAWRSEHATRPRPGGPAPGRRG